VELLSNGANLPEVVSVNSDGSFELHSPAAGMHELRVTESGKLIHQEQVYISGPNARISVRLPEAPVAANPAAGNTISLRQLEHRIPPSAQKAYARGQKAANKGDKATAIGCFTEAVRLDPEFADAHNNLGAAYADQGELPQAAGEFQKTIDLEPEHRLALANLAIVLARMKNYSEAAPVARRTLKLYPGLGKIRFILAVSLLATQGDAAEVLENLERAAADVPRAHLLAADLLEQTGRRAEAVKHLEDFLHTAPPDDSQRPKAEARLAQLQHAP
jgi:tetratricopeptide (TPR) repeat protein